MVIHLGCLKEQKKELGWLMGFQKVHCWGRNFHLDSHLGSNWVMRLDGQKEKHLGMQKDWKRGQHLGMQRENHLV